jgi:hypothetical protein
MSSTLVPSKPAYQWATDGTVRPRSWQAESPRPNRERVQAGRFLIAFCLGVLATLAWQSYGDPARKMIAKSSPRLSWLAPSPAPVGDATFAAPSSDQEELKTLSASSSRIAAARRPDRGATPRCSRADDARNLEQAGGGRT